MPRIIRAFPDITLVVVGEGELKASLKQEAYELGIENNVLFPGPRLDIPELLKLFDLYVLPSLWEGMPMVLLEAMAAECPVVATDVGGVARVIEHEQNGLLIPPRDPEALAVAVVKLLSDENLRDKFKKNGLAKFRQKFSAEIMTRKYEQLYLRQN